MLPDVDGADAAKDRGSRRLPPQVVTPQGQLTSGFQCANIPAGL